MAVPRYNVDVWNTKKGLPENTVIAMTRTHDGYLWLGTYNGCLVRFDGVRFTTFDESTTPGLDNSPIVYLFEDSRSNLWVGTQSSGVLLIKNGIVFPQPIGGHTRESRLVSACEDSSGAIWFYTMDGRVFRYSNDQVQEAHIPTLDVPSNCRALISEKSGLVWMGTDRRVFGINPNPAVGAEFVEKVLEVTNQLDFLLASKSGGYWRFASHEIQKWNGDHLERSLGAYPWHTRINCACEDRDGHLVIGTDNEGIWLIDAEGKTPPVNLSDTGGLSSDTILSVSADAEGSVWVGTDGRGLNRIQRELFEVVPETRGVTVLSVRDDGHDGMWFGTFGGGLRHLQNNTVEQIGVAQADATNLAIRSICVDADKKTWVGADGNGVLLVNGASFARPVEFAKANQHISVIFEDRNHRLWFGTQGGLVLYDGRSWRVMTTRDNLSSDVIRAIADDADGNVWIGTDGGGVNRWHDGQITAFQKKDGLPSDHVSALFVDAENILWVGTSSGLGRFHAGAWSRYTTAEGLAGNSIDYLNDDAQSNLWVGSSAGLMRVSKQSLADVAQGRQNHLECRTYGEPDGLPTRECTPGAQPATWRTGEGELWFATISGLVYVNPAELRQNTNLPPVVIESVEVGGAPIETNNLRVSLPPVVIVPAGREGVDIQYTSLNLAAADKTRFRYRMEGHDHLWTEAGETRSAHYPNLPPGNYLFHVIAGNEDDVWNYNGATLAFIIEPPYWQKWWFRTAMALVLLGLIISIVRYLSTQRLQRQLEGMRQQQALEKERARIARDIHDQLGASLTQVSMLGEMVESDKNEPAEVEAHARQISQTARDTSRVLDEIVWTVNPSNDTLEGLINYVCKYAQEYFAVAGLRYRLDVPAQLPATDISPEVRHNVFLAAKEAVTNVVRHAKATEVWLRLHFEPGKFILELQDNGRGPVGLEGKQSRNGLRNMHKRMEDVGGSFSITAAPGGGALVRLTVPIRNVE
jgi:ligand-binding sensor domain-containing protein/signal transduction histidine kinase